MRKILQTAIGLSHLASRFDLSDDKLAMNLIFLPTRQMRTLNFRYTGFDRPTDVLAFDLHRGETPAAWAETEPAVAAEIYVCPDLAVQAARTYSTTPAYELFLYLVHGMLHLAGHDDHDPVLRRRMRRAEKRIMVEIFKLKSPETWLTWPPIDGNKTAATAANGKTAGLTKAVATANRVSGYRNG